MNFRQLPVTRDLSPAYGLSFVAAALMTAASLAGLLLPDFIYSTDELRRSFLPNDVVNLFIGLPLLLAAMGLTRRGRLIGFLFWPGSLFYITYNYTAYAVAMPWTLPFVLFLSLVILSACAIFRLLSSMDLAAVQSQLKGRVAERLCGGVLAGFGALFFFRGIVQLAQGTASGAEGAVVFVDLFTTPFWVIGGLMLWRKQPLGYALGEKTDDPLQMYLADIFTISVNLAGVPGISIPCGFTSDNLPIGLQLIGKHFDEETLLQAAYAYEQSTDWHRRKPDL